MSLSRSVRKFIEKERLFLPSNTLLCAVSGGMDSMAMLDFLRSEGYRVIVAHVNYMLRGEESLKDQALVEDYCAQYNILVHSLRMNEEETKELKSGNLQEKAREIRYNWMESIRKEASAKYICVAHHRMDVVETFLLHAIRGAGMTGLRSIQSINNCLRRPLLQSSQINIKDYVKKHNIPYRHDQSNFDDDYDRNYIRNQVMPKITERWKHGVQNISNSAFHLSKDHELLRRRIRKEKKRWITIINKIVKFGGLDRFRKIRNSETIAFYLLKEYGFDYITIQRMVFEAHDTGAKFKSNDYTALINRNYLLIKRINLNPIKPINVIVDVPVDIITPLGNLLIDKVKSILEEGNTNIVNIDLYSVRWPLTLRNWKNGDMIAPLGLKGNQKKVSDILIDQKASLFDKKNQLVLVDGLGEIIWLIGRKLSESFKYDGDTAVYMRIEWQE